MLTPLSCVAVEIVGTFEVTIYVCITITRDKERNEQPCTFASLFCSSVDCTQIVSLLSHTSPHNSGEFCLALVHSWNYFN